MGDFEYWTEVLLMTMMVMCCGALLMVEALFIGAKLSGL